MQRFFFSLILLLVTSASCAKEFKITEVNARFTSQSLNVDALFELSLNEVVIDAIHNGIPVTLSTTIELYRPRRFYLDKRLAEWRFDYTLRYHSLTATYILESPFVTQDPSFSKLQSALQEISRFSFNTEIVEETLPESTRGYYLNLNIGLDIDALPTPLQVVAFASPAWRLKSETYQWFAQK